MNLSGLLQRVVLLTAVRQILCHTLHFKVQEEEEEGVKIGALSEYSPPYQLLTTEDTGYVRVDEKGDLYTTERKIDREAPCTLISVDAVVGQGQDQELVKVLITVEDINDNAPQFEESEIRLSVAEDASVGTRFLLDDLAQDRDAGDNAELHYHLEGAHGLFGLTQSESSLELVVQTTLDRETQDSHRVTLVAVDGGLVPLSATTILIITVEDVNDNCPRFDPEGPHTATVTGDPRGGTELARIEATDPDLGQNAEITYSFGVQISDRAKALFRIDKRTGQITLTRDVKIDSPEVHVLKVYASGPLCPFAHIDVTIYMQPEANPEPGIKIKFIAKHENRTILLEENEPPTALALLELTDTSTVKSVLSLAADDTPFSLKLHAGRYLLSTSKPLDFEVRREYLVTVVIKNTEGECLLVKEVIKVQIQDVNDNAPSFELPRYEKDLEENNEPGALLLQVRAVDADSQLNGKVSYRLTWNSPDIFSVNPMTGQLFVSESLDREQQGSYYLTVLARDHGTPWREASVPVRINVLDQNDNRPAFLTPRFIFFVSESIPHLGHVGKVGVTDEDHGENGRVVDVRVLNDSVPFAFDHSQGTLRSTGEVDREKRERYELLLLARDGGTPPLSSTAWVTVFVEDVNDNQPQVILPSSNLSCLTVSPTTRAGTMVTKIYAIDEDSGMNSDITYHIIAREPEHPSPFEIDPRTGNITLVQHLGGRDYGMYHLFIVVSDGGKPAPLQATVWVNLLINDTQKQCHLSSVPEYSPRSDTAPASAPRCQDNDGRTEHAQLVFLIGVGMMVVSLCVLLAAVVIFVKYRQKRPEKQKSVWRESELRPLN
ncbi:protocadherin-20 [Chanos chanos]|uniref:Protocadherin-20 n=1 Tax=Chanos chanos TaxID=29144 RepID=A0A6J2UTY2_CHACN|nr:protocadherin-20-like [Chanos chanos]